METGTSRILPSSLKVSGRYSHPYLSVPFQRKGTLHSKQSTLPTRTQKCSLNQFTGISDARGKEVVRDRWEDGDLGRRETSLVTIQ